MSKKQFEFNILGQKIVIKSAEEAALAEVAVKIVDEKLKVLQDAKPLLSPQQISILALLEIAGDLVKNRSLIDEYRRELDQKCSLLLQDLDEGTQGRTASA